MFAQILAVIIFLAMFAFIAADRLPRHIVSLAAGALTVMLVFGVGMRSLDAVSEALNLGALLTPSFWYGTGEGLIQSGGINWETIIFVFGMMVMVEGMAETGFFRWLCLCIAKLARMKPLRIFISFMLLSAVLSMFIDSITVILFLAAVTLELAGMLGFDPVPFVLAEVFCANLGGSATMCGDPPNIIIGTSLGYTFTDFLFNTGLAALITLALTVLYFYLVCGRQIRAQAHSSGGDIAISPSAVIKNRLAFAYSCAVFIFAVVLLVTHARTGLSVASIGLAAAILTLIPQYKNALKILRRIDWRTLAFFIGLFVAVSGLEQTGVLNLLARLIGSISGGDAALIVAIILWLSAVSSALIDNIPFAATMLPIIRALAATTGTELPVLAWSLAIGADIGGSATPIGASANVVGMSALDKSGRRLSWGKYCRIMMPAASIVIAASMAYIFIRYL